MQVVILPNNVQSISHNKALNKQKTKAGNHEIYYSQTLDLCSVISILQGYLTESELRRANKYYVEQDKQTYIACHGFLRLLLGRRMKENPREIEFFEGNHHKPGIADGNICFNLTHTREAFAIGISNALSVGIDLEKIKYQADMHAIVESYFSKEERNYIFERNKNAAERFSLLWTRKEALLKALGVGLIDHLSKIEVVRKKNIIPDDHIKNSNPDFIFKKLYIYSGKLQNGYLSLATPQETPIDFYHIKLKYIISMLNN